MIKSLLDGKDNQIELLKSAEQQQLQQIENLNQMLRDQFQEMEKGKPGPGSGGLSKSSKYFGLIPENDTQDDAKPDQPPGEEDSEGKTSINVNNEHYQKALEEYSALFSLKSEAELKQALDNIIDE